VSTSSLNTSASLALVTASFNTGTRNLTFTKGDTTQFSVNIPDVSGSGIPTGTVSSSAQILAYNIFATTGSNSFNGSQNITGSMTSSLDIRVAGVRMGFGNAAGTSSIAIGNNTLLVNTGNNNIAIGERAMDVNTTGNSNIAMGLDALGANTTGGQNIAIGEAAFRDNITGLQNVVIGHNAAYNAGNVSGNTLIGQGAGLSIKNNNNTIVGQSAGVNITSGSENTIMGKGAGANIGSGSQNTFIGAESGADISGSQNTFIGRARGVGNFSNVIALSDGAANIRAIYNSGWVMTGSVDIQNTLTASLAQGFTYVGNASGRTTLVATSSFGTPIPTGTISGSSQITALGFVSSSVTASSLITASFSGNTLTFTKGDASTFGVIIPDISGSTIDTGSFATTGSNSFNGDQTITGSLIISSSANFDLIITGAAKVVNSTGLIELGLLPNSFNVNSTKSTSPAQGYIYGPTGSNAQFNLGVYDDPNFNTDVELSIKADTNGLSFNDWDNVTVFDYIPFLTIAPNLGNNPAPVMTRGLQVTGSTQIQNFTASLQQGYVWVGDSTGKTVTVATSSFGGGGTINTGSFATTGSNNFIGNQTITGSLLVSGSDTIDVNVVGRVSITGPTSGETPRLFISSSDGAITELSRNFNQINTTKVSGVLDAFGQVYANTSSVAGMYVGVYDDPNFNTDVEVAILVTENGSTFNDWDNGTTFNYVPFMTLTPNTGNNPTPRMTRGLNITGNTTITGSLIQSGAVSIQGDTTFKNKNGDTSNVILGSNAMSNITGSIMNSVAIGTGAMRYASGSSQNVAIGANALAVTTGTNNFGLGNEALANNREGNQNMAIGVGALNANISGNINVAIGNDALFYNQAGGQVAIGANALKQSTTGGQNLAIGFAAMQENTIGEQNVAIGAAAGRDNKTGIENVYIGWTAGVNAGNVNLNTIIGARAGSGIKSGENTIIGWNAASNITSGSGNTIIGSRAGEYVSSGNNNIFIGNYTGQNVSGSYNTLIGKITGSGNWNNVIALSDGQGNIEAIYSGSVWSMNAPVNFTTGSNQQAGTAVLNGGNPGTVTVSNSLVTANSIIMVSKQTLAHSNGYVAVSAKSAGSFTITSNHNGDTDTVGWFIINNS
jgi:hypothetical protein